MTDRKFPTRGVFAALSRSAVPRAGAVYVVAAMAVVVVTNLVGPYIGLSRDALITIIGVLVFAFPLTLALAWIFDGGPGGIEGPHAGVGTAGPSAPDRPRGEVRPNLPPAPPPRQGELDPRSVAVLYFETSNGNEEARTLAAGFHADLLRALGKLQGLTVVGRRSAAFYRDISRPTAEIARELNVGTILEGSLQIVGGQAQVSVRLADATQDSYRWAERYERVLSPQGFVEIQTEVCRRITASLFQDLGPDLRPPPPRETRPATADVQAYRACALGLQWLDHPTADGLARALRAFRAAAGQDPGYALAWAGQAEALALLHWYRHPVPEGAPDPEHAARHALGLDPGLAEAHTALAILHALAQDGPAARRDLERATELNPGLADPHPWLAWILLALGSPEEALAAAQRALRLDPLAPAVHLVLAEAYLANRRYQEARTHVQRAVELDPSSGLAHYMDGLVAYHRGEMVSARAALERSLPLVPPAGAPPRVSAVRAVLGLVHLASGRRAEAATELKALGQEVGNRGSGIAADPADLYAIGLLHLGLGDTDLALDLFRRVSRWDPVVTEEIRYLYPDIMDPLRSDPRFQRVMGDVDRSWRLDGS